MGFDREQKQGQPSQEPLEILKESATDDQAKLDAVISSLELVKREGKSVLLDVQPETENRVLPSGPTMQSSEPTQSDEGKVIDFNNYSSHASGFGSKLLRDRVLKKAA